MRYQVELVWNREFDFVPYGGLHPSLDIAIAAAKRIENSGDGEAVKKTRVLDEHGTVVYKDGRKV